MHIQACALIYNLARKGENAKRVAWNEFQQHCTLSSLPPLLPLCTADALRRPGGFCKHAVIPATFPQEENPSGLTTNLTTKAELSTTWFARKQEQELQNKTALLRAPLVHHHCSSLSLEPESTGHDPGRSTGRAGTHHGLKPNPLTLSTVP